MHSLVSRADWRGVNSKRMLMATPTHHLQYEPRFTKPPPPSELAVLGDLRIWLDAGYPRLRYEK
jgi:hypothetical protein